MNYDHLIENNAELISAFKKLLWLTILLLGVCIVTMIIEIGFFIEITWNDYLVKNIGWLFGALVVVGIILKILNNHASNLERKKRDKEDEDKWNNIS